MAHNSSSNPSDHPNTATALRIRGVKLKLIEKLNFPRPLTDVCREFKEVVTSAWPELDNWPLVEKDLEDLEESLEEDFESEADFDNALFKALRGSFTAKRDETATGLAGPSESNVMVLASEDTNARYAVGFARQVRAALDLLPKDAPKQSIYGTGSNSSTSSGLTRQSRSDHSVCLFEKIAGSWKVLDCFGIIEIKLSDTSCQEFELSINGTVDAVDLGASHGALGQVIWYTLGSVVLYLARRGKMEDQLPLVVIAGRKKKKGGAVESEAKKVKRLGRLRWVWSLLHVPAELGNSYQYSVQGFDRFYEKKSEQEEVSVKNALSLYLDTMLFGLKLALAVRNDLANGQIPLPLPASGRFLMIGEITLELKYCASPILGANFDAMEREGHEWDISQGDLFFGNVNLRDVLRQPRITYVSFVGQLKKKESNVLVKVSSKTVHTLLIDPIYTMFALAEVKKGTKKLVKEIGSVLLAVVQMDVGLISFMADLSKSGYLPLTPESHPNDLAVLWAGFCELVENVLLPMAEMEVVHPDIRPGFDLTSNILCKVDSGCRGKKATMKLIDYDSLVQFRFFFVPESNGKKDGRFIGKMDGWTATTYVWWQCVAIAFVWSTARPADRLGDERGDDNVMTVLTQILLHNVSGPDWLVSLRPHVENNMDSKFVKETLAKLGKLFDGPDSP